MTYNFSKKGHFYLGQRGHFNLGLTQKTNHLTKAILHPIIQNMATYKAEILQFSDEATSKTIEAISSLVTPQKRVFETKDLSKAKNIFNQRIQTTPLEPCEISDLELNSKFNYCRITFADPSDDAILSHIIARNID